MLVNTEIIKNNIVSLKNESKYYKNKTSSFSSFLDDNNKNLSSYIRNINSIYINISNNIESVSNYISDYINDLESVENLMSGKQGYIKSSITNSVVSKTKNSIKKHIIDDGSIFEITDYSGSSGSISNKNEDKNVNNKSNYSSIISLVKKAISENKDVNEILKMYSIVDIRNAMMLFPGVITLDMLSKAFNKEDNPFDNIEYPYDGKEDELKNGVKVSDIKNLIYGSQYLNQNEKDFIFNENLLSKVVPLYNIKSKLGDFVNESKERHTDLQIVLIDFKTSPSDAYYEPAKKNKIHMDKNYKFELIFENSKDVTAKVFAHEYIHLLQVEMVPNFIKEPCAEIISHEFYMESSLVDENGNDDYGLYSNYGDASKYVKILMEIIGSDIIFEANFSELGMYNLQKVLMGLLDENDYKDFMREINMGKPAMYHSYEILEELLSKMYKKKYGIDMYENGLIDAILNDRPYNRVYFNDELRKKQKDYYYEISGKNAYSVKYAYNKGYLDIYPKKSIRVSEEEYNNYTGCNKSSTLESLIDNVSIDFEDGVGWYVKVIDSSGEKTLVLSEAINQGYVEYHYYINKTKNDIDNDMENLSIDELKKYYDIVPKEDSNIVYDKEKNIVYKDKLKKVEIESLTN